MRDSDYPPAEISDFQAAGAALPPGIRFWGSKLIHVGRRWCSAGDCTGSNFRCSSG